MSKVVATATCANLPDWEVDDRPLFAALKRRGVDLYHPYWDDPTFDWDRCDACLIRTTWDYQERRGAFLEWAKRVSACTRLFNPYDLVEWNTDKRYLRNLEDKGVRIVPSLWFEPGSKVDLVSEIRTKGWDRAFLKPVVGSTARETIRFDATGQSVQGAQQHLDRLLANEAMILQPYFSGVETDGEVSALYVDGDFTHAVRKVPVRGDYRVQDDFGGKDEPVSLSEAEHELIREVLSKVDFDWLYARLDFLRDDEGQLCLSELEMVEPSFFFRHSPEAADKLADALCLRL